MSQKRDDGGPAFAAPGVYGDENVGHQVLERGELGMTLRDYFAAAALTGILADPDVEKRMDQTVVDFRASLAVGAYAFADAMLEARKQ